MTRLTTEVYVHLGVYNLIGPPFQYHSKLVKLHTNFKKKCYNLICIRVLKCFWNQSTLKPEQFVFVFCIFFYGLGAIQFSVLPVNAIYTSFS